MKNRRTIYRILVIIPVILFLMFTLSCNSSNISKVEFGTDNNVVLFGEIDFSDYYLNVTYKNGTKEQITVTESMIDKDDYFKLFEIGTHDITFYYDNFYTTATFIVNINHFSSDLQFVTNDTYNGERVFVQKYDGLSHSLELTNDYPVDTQIVYPDGNSFSECKSTPYTVRAILTKDGYEPKEIVGKLLIVSNEFPSELFDSISFSDASYTYDGKEKMIEATNIPAGLDVEYKIVDSLGRKVENAIDAGTYNITATFKSNNHNYELTKNTLSATLTIEKAQIKVNSIGVDDVNKVYDGLSANIKVYGSCPDGVGYDLIIKDLSGNVITDATNAGSYVAEVIFKTDSNHYVAPEKLTSNIVISKRVVDLSSLSYGLEEVYFNGEVKRYTLLDNLLEDFIEPSFTYYLNETTLCEEPILPGTYYVDIKYCVKNDSINNYEVINVPEDAAILIINEVINLISLTYPTQNVVYDGTAKEYTLLSSILGPLASYITPLYEYYLEGSINPTTPVDVGSYSVKINYILSEEVKDCNIINIPNTDATLIISSSIE